MCRTGPSRRTHAGFTLLELLIVLAVIGLVAGLAGPRLTTGGGSLNADLAMARDALRRAQLTALGQGESQWVGFATDPPALIVPNAERQAFAPGTRLTLETAAEATRQGAPGFVFTPDGGSSGGDLRLDRQGRAAGLRVHWATGHVDVWKDQER